MAAPLGKHGVSDRVSLAGHTGSEVGRVQRSLRAGQQAAQGDLGELVSQLMHSVKLQGFAVPAEVAGAVIVGFPTPPAVAGLGRRSDAGFPNRIKHLI
jgi:hypothetical protein